MARREFTWTSKQLDRLEKIQAVLVELNEYKPLTLRQIYYQLVGAGYIENNVSQYTMLSQLLKQARLEGYVPWDAMEDRVRNYHDLTGFENSSSFINTELHYFLRDYQRNLLQSQDIYLEIWIEKDALSSIFTKVAEKYTCPVVVARGFSSVSFLNNYRERISEQNKKPLILYFGDFDPSGNIMLESMQITLINEMKLHGIEFKRVALSLEDISKYNLPVSIDAIKTKDTRTKKHVERYGEVAVELDALPPAILVKKIKDAIEGAIDIELFNSEVRKHNSELDRINEIREKTIEFLTNNY